MTDLIRVRSLVAAAALVAAATACTRRSDTRREADRAAATVRDKVEELDLAREAQDLGESARELAEAMNEFRVRRMVRIGTLRAVHAVAASQPMLISAFAHAFPLVEEDRAEVQEKLVIFQMRLDEADNAIQSLELVEATDWEAHDDAVSKALERVEDARDRAWKALEEADRTSDRTSQR